jgi:hypothetical protein
VRWLRLLALVGLALAGALVLRALREEPVPVTLLGLPEDARVESITIEYRGQPLAVRRTEGGWRASTGPLAADAARTVDALAEGLLRADPGRLVTSLAAHEDRRADFGLGTPEVVVVVDTRARTVRVLFGDTSPLGAEAYVAVVETVDDPLEVRLVSAGLRQLFVDTWHAWRKAPDSR